MKTALGNGIAQIFIVFLVYAFPLWIPGGFRAWLSAWIFLTIWFGFLLFLLVWLYRHNPGLFQERLKVSSKEQQGWDKIYTVLINFSIFIWLLFIAIDVQRFHWTPVSLWLHIIGAFILLCACYLLFLTFRENSYLSPFASVQKDRGQTLISTGPYHYIRHPMYTAMLIFVLATPLLLGAWSGIIVGILFVLVLARRAVLEERMLSRGLPGYADYMERVKYRLVPFIW